MLEARFPLFLNNIINTCDKHKDGVNRWIGHVPCPRCRGRVAQKPVEIAPQFSVRQSVKQQKNPARRKVFGLKALLQKSTMKRTEIADIVQVKVKTMYDHSACNNGCSPEQIAAYAKAFGVPESAVIGRG